MPNTGTAPFQPAGTPQGTVSVQKFLQALQGVPGFTGDMNAPLQFYQGKSPNQLLQEISGGRVTDPMNQQNAMLPGPLKNNSFMGDMGGALTVLAAPLMVAGAQGLMAGAGGGIGGIGDLAGGLSSVDVAAGMVPEFGTHAGYAAGTGFNLGGAGGLSYSGEGLTQLVNDAGGETIWQGGDFSPTGVDDVVNTMGDAGGQGVGGLGTDETIANLVNEFAGGAGGSGGILGGLGSLLGGIPGSVWGSLISGGVGLLAQDKAVDAQTKAAEDARNLQLQMYNQNRADLAPWREAGVGALNQINSRMPEFTRRFGMSDYEQDPGYQFRLSEGEKGINRAAQARGLWDSGSTLKALARYNSNMGSQEFGNAYNRFTQDQTNAYNKLSNLAGLGQTSAQQTATLGGQYAANAGELGMQGANARASGYIGGANTIANAINQGISGYQQNQYMPYLRGYLGGP